MKNININEYFVITKTAQGKPRATIQVAWLTPEQNTAATNMWYAVSDAGYLSTSEKNDYYRQILGFVNSKKPAATAPAPKEEVAPAPEEVVPAPVEEAPAPVEEAPEAPVVPAWVSRANQNPPGTLQKFKVLKQLYEQGTLSRIFNTEDLPSTSIDGSAINKTGIAESDAPLLMTENSKRDTKRREYSLLANMRYRPRSGESMEEFSMRLATPQSNANIDMPGLSPDEIREITGQSWSQESYQKGLDAKSQTARKRAVLAKARPQLKILDAQYRAANIQVQEMPRNRRSSARARLKARYVEQKQNIMSNAEQQLA